MKRKTRKNAKGKRTAAAPEKVKAVRDNVLGRRPSKCDPLGEQPGTVARNPEALEPRVPAGKGSVPSNP